MAKPAAVNPNDCLLLFSAALSAPPSSTQQRTTLSRLRAQFDLSPAVLPILYPSLLGLLGAQNPAPHLRRWVAGIIELAVCRPNPSADQRLQLVLQSTETILRLLSIQDGPPSELLETKKLAIQAAASAYPLIFKVTCTKATADSRQWGFASQIKSVILGLWRNEAAPLGLRLAATKYVQRVVQVGTRGAADPRKRAEDPSIAMCPAGTHPFLKPKELEQESSALLEECVKILYQARSPELASAVIIATGSLVRHRPSLASIIIGSLAVYIPPSSALASRSLTSAQLKGVEKTLRITLSHLDRTLPASSHTPQIREALVNQARRLEELNERERDRKRQRKEEEVVVKKRMKAAAAAAAQANALDASTVSTPPFHPEEAASQLPGFDVTTLPVELVVELVMANLLVLTDQALHEAIKKYRLVLNPPDPTSHISTPIPAVPSAMFQARQLGQTQSSSTPGTPSSVLPVVPNRSGSPVRPTMELITEAGGTGAMNMQFPNSSHTTGNPLSEESLYDRDDKLDDEDVILPITPPMDDDSDRKMMIRNGMGSKGVFLDNWEPERPLPLTEPHRRLLLRMTLDRIASNSSITENGERTGSLEGVWSTLLARLVTRGMAAGEGGPIEEVEGRREDVRRALFGFVVTDFPKRMHFARVWLMEEWLASRRSPHEFEGTSALPPSMWSSAYDRWLSLILDHILAARPSSTPPTQPDTSRQALSHFLLDLPHLPDRELNRLGQLCQDPAKLTVGFTTLRELANMRPTMRYNTLDVLLGLTTHSRRQTRNAAIVCVKSWVGSSARETKGMGERVVSFAIQLLQKLEAQDEDEEESARLEACRSNEEAVEMEDGETREGDERDAMTFAKVENAVIVSGLGTARDENMVIQHLELLLALSVKNPDLLDHLFRVYPNMPPAVQQSVHKLMTPLIRSLGGKHNKIVSLIQNCQSGSEPLVLRILAILTEKGKPPAAMIEAIKTLALTATDLSPRFIIPMISDLSKAEVTHHLPRILSLLNGTGPEKAEVRSVFEAIVQQPPNNFGSVSTNAPRVRQSDLLTPVELLVLLHQTDDGWVSIKQAIEAIGLCFSMTEIFKPEVLAAFMQQVVDEMTLPTLFLRTVIQAVQTYKSLQPFVSTTLLSRLIIKKIWTQAQLWEGFMRCAKIIAPHSFGALLQLPREQLRELVVKQAGLRAPLREYVVKKAGNNKGRVASLLEILSDEPIPIQATGSGGGGGDGGGEGQTQTEAGSEEVRIDKKSEELVATGEVIGEGESAQPLPQAHDPGRLISAAVG